MKKDIMARLAEGPVLGDGGYLLRWRSADTCRRGRLLRRSALQILRR